jgi:hypothetical protein
VKCKAAQTPLRKIKASGETQYQVNGSSLLVMNDRKSKSCVHAPEKSNYADIPNA